MPRKKPSKKKAARPLSPLEAAEKTLRQLEAEEIPLAAQWTKVSRGRTAGAARVAKNQLDQTLHSTRLEIKALRADIERLRREH